MSSFSADKYLTPLPGGPSQGSSRPFRKLPYVAPGVREQLVGVMYQEKRMTTEERSRMIAGRKVMPAKRGVSVLRGMKGGLIWIMDGATVLIPDFEDKMIVLYNGKHWHPIRVTAAMINQTAGSLVETTSRPRKAYRGNRKRQAR